MKYFLESIVSIPEDLLESAAKHTTETLRRIDRIRRELDMPIEQFPLVAKTYAQSARMLRAEGIHRLRVQQAMDDSKEIEGRTRRLPLTLQSDDCMPPGRVVKVIIQHKKAAFRPEDLAIDGDRSRWRVHDLLVGNRPQFEGTGGSVVGTEFGPGGICEHLRMDTAQLAMEIALKIEYTGPDPKGEIFQATLVGEALEF